MAVGSDEILDPSRLLSIIIPAYNEEERIGYTIDSIQQFMLASLRDMENLGKFIDSYELIVVDDGSNDKTVDIAQKRGAKVLKQSPNQGKGAAVKRGMLEASGEYRLFSDADLSTPIHELLPLMQKVDEGFDIAIGSRGLDYGKIKKHQPIYRELMGKTFNKIVRFFAVSGISDTQCGFKLFKAKAAEQIFGYSRINGFGFDVELLYLADRLGFKIAEVPVEWHNDERSKVNPILDPLKMLRDTLQLRAIHRDVPSADNSPNKRGS